MSVLFLLLWQFSISPPCFFIFSPRLSESSALVLSIPFPTCSIELSFCLLVTFPLVHRYPLLYQTTPTFPQLSTRFFTQISSPSPPPPPPSSWSCSRILATLVVTRWSRGCLLHFPFSLSSSLAETAFALPRFYKEEMRRLWKGKGREGGAIHLRSHIFIDETKGYKRLLLSRAMRPI